MAKRALKIESGTCFDHLGYNYYYWTILGLAWEPILNLPRFSHTCLAAAVFTSLENLFFYEKQGLLRPRIPQLVYP
jgi:hypothetical protein